MQTIVFFPDSAARLEPFHVLRPAHQLTQGVFSLEEVVKLLFPEEKILSEYPEFIEPGRYLFVNSTVLTPWELKNLPEDEGAFWNHDVLIAARMTVHAHLKHNDVINLAKQLPRHDVAGECARFMWNYINAAERRITEDVTNGTFPQNPVSAGTVNPDQIFVGENCTIAPGVVLDASKGPILIRDNATIAANSVVMGPASIGEKATVNPLTLIRPGTSLGYGCKVGGEVAGTIMLPYSNKQHYGYLGRSYVGSWCNLGAGSSTSTIKNTHGALPGIIGNERFTVPQHSCGSMVGDYTMVGCNVNFAPVSVIGVGCSIVGSGSIPAYMPPFMWWDTEHGSQEYRLDKALEVAERVMERRDLHVTPELQKTLEIIHETTARDRQELLAA